SVTDGPAALYTSSVRRAVTPLLRLALSDEVGGCHVKMLLPLPTVANRPFTPAVSRRSGADPSRHRSTRTASCGAPALSPRSGRRARDSAREARGAADCERTPPGGAASIAAKASGCPGS